MWPVQLAQAIYAAAWALVLVWSTRETLRFFRAPTVADGYGALRLFGAAVNIGFIVRWYMWPGVIRSMGPEELSWWLGLYSLGTIVALGYLGACIASRGWKP